MTSRSLAALPALAAAGAIAVAAAAPAQTPQAPAPKITGTGVGEIRLGMTHRALRGAGLVGRMRQGCELGGPQVRAARLSPPLKGSVDLSLRSPRKVVNIAVTGGATARGIGVGSTVRAIRRTFPRAKFDHSTEGVFEMTLVKVAKRDGGPFQFAVDMKTRKVTLVGIPAIPFCE
jgi:hypothetical protein